MTSQEQESKLTKDIGTLFSKSKNKTFVEATKRAQAQGITNHTDFVNFVADQTGTDLNSVIGNTAVLIGEQ
ncbi:MAG: hypothetical protein J6S67_12090 [Methanobrevibacter sp.]|nr:hypothetical protein [Methanobrevibacter sp.]